MFWLRRVVVVTACCAGLFVNTGAKAAAKDESAAEWLAPKWFNEWHDELAAKGLNFGATYIGDFIGNVSGGTSRGFIHLGRFDFSVDADLEKLVGWTGGRFFANTYEIYGRGLTRDYIHNLAPISESEALPDARLYNAYFEQSFYNNALNIRVGQQAADVEFFDSQTDDLFINGTFGWPAIKAAPACGGPSPPIAAPGIRIKAALSDRVTVFGAVFNGNPAQPGEGDPQLRDDHGLAFRVNDAPLGDRSGSLRLRYGDRRPSARRQFHAGGLVPFRTIRRSALHRARPVDRRSERNRHRGKASRRLRNIRDCRANALSAAIGDRKGRFLASLPGVTVFGRIAYSPPDRNLIDLYLDGGVGFVGFVPNPPTRPLRDGDSLYADFGRRPKPRSRHPVL